MKEFQALAERGDEPGGGREEDSLALVEYDRQSLVRVCVREASSRVAEREHEPSPRQGGEHAIDRERVA
jgi:hypothetical protein